MKLSSKSACFTAAVCLYLIALRIYAPLAPGDPYHYDEADYMWAGKQGLVANYTDRNGLSFYDWVSKGLDLMRNPGKRQGFSEYIRTAGDIGMYRHYHGPAYAYWLALVQHAGVTRESVFRGSGLLIHGMSAFLILFGFWAVFPSLPPPAGLMAFALFVFNKTALTATTTITQHGIFTMLCIATIFVASRFMRDLEAKWFYILMAMAGVCLVAVETSLLLFPATFVALAADYRKVREKWPTLKAFGGLLLKGLGFYLLAILVCWPKGVLQLGMAKGLITLAYFAIVRRNFSPIGPAELFARLFASSPWEFSFLIAGTMAGFLVWRKADDRRAMIPWLAFIAVFIGVLLKVTLPYTYYFAPLTAAMTVACGIAFGELWKRGGTIWRYAVPLLAVVSIIGTTVRFQAVLAGIQDIRTFESAALKHVRENPNDTAGRLYMPFQLVPTLHYYLPELKTVGYDVDFPIARLIDGLQADGSAPIMLCEEPVCNDISARVPGLLGERKLLDAPGPNKKPFYSVRLLQAGKL